MTRIQLQMEYTFDEPWGIQWRIPIELKSRTSSVGDIDPASTPEQIEAMDRNLQIHHPSRDMRGFGDIEMLLTWHGHDVGKEGAIFSTGLGTSLPIGRTEHDPYELGDEGEAHEHIQFGSGTLDPLVDVFYARPVGEDSMVSLYGRGRFPIRESSKGFKGSSTLQGGIGYVKKIGKLGPWEPAYAILGVIYQDQGVARWHGEVDPNTGYNSISGTIGINWKDEEYRSWNLSLVLPISTNTAESAEGTFDPGPILSLGVSF